MTSRGARPFTSVLIPRREVLEGQIVDAVNLADIYLYNMLRGIHPAAEEVPFNILFEPEEFLKRTYFSEAMKQIILKVLGALAGSAYLYLDERGEKFPVTSRVLIIPSNLGGGKSHLLATLLYISKLINEKSGPELHRILPTHLVGDKRFKHAFEHAAESIRSRGKISVVAIVGDVLALAPSPDNPVVINGVKIYTPWGMLGYLLGEYDEVKPADEGHYAPRVDQLRRMLRGKTTLILIDEAVEYMELAVRLDSKYKGYSESFLSFLRDLSVAVNDTPNTCLVITLPAEYREGKLISGLQHPEYVERINAMLTRVAHEYIPPLEFKLDVTEVFKKRLFENADSAPVEQALNAVVTIIKEAAERDSTLKQAISEKYGDVASLIEKLKTTYPFHPYFIELMVNVVSANPRLGLTRYLLSYVSKLVKYTYEIRESKGRDPRVSLITPWLIQLDRVELRTELIRGFLAQDQNNFQRIFEQDVKDFSSTVETALWYDQRLTPELRRNFIRGALARTLWVATIPGRGGKTREAIKYYPVSTELPILVYDPLAFEDIVAADVLNTLDELLLSSTYLSKTHDGRVFYALVPDLLKLLRERYVDRTDYHARTTLENHVMRALKKGRKFESVHVITTDRVREIEELYREELAEKQSPVLFIYLGLTEPPPDLDDVLLVRNNVALLLPDYSANPVDRGLFFPEYVRKVIGSEPSNVKDYIKSILKLLHVVNELYNEREYLKESFGEEFLDHVLSTLKRFKDELEKQLNTAIYSSLRKAVIGLRKTTYEIELRQPEVSQDLSAIARLVEEQLERRGVPTAWDWRTICHYLGRYSEIWDTDCSLKKPTKVSELWEQLLKSTSVTPHLTSFEDFKEALKTAYEENLVAFARGDEIYWLKHPYTPQEAEQYYRTAYKIRGRLNDWGRDIEQELRKRGINTILDLEAVSPVYIVQKYIDRLNSRAFVRPGEKVLRRLVVYLPDGKRESFREFELKQETPVKIVEALSRHPVVLEEEIPSRTFDLLIESVNDQPFTRGVLVEVEGFDQVKMHVKGRVVAEESFPVRVLAKLIDEAGSIAASVEKEVKAPGEFQVELRVEKAGKFHLLVSATEPLGYRVDDTPVARVIVKGEKCFEKDVYVYEGALRDYATPGAERGVELVEIKVNGLLRGTTVLDLKDVLTELGRAFRAKVNGSFTLGIQEEKLDIRFHNVSASRVASVLTALSTQIVAQGSIGELNADIAVAVNAPIVSILGSDVVKTRLLAHGSPLGSTTKLKVRECIRI